MSQWARLNGFEPARHHLYLIDKLEAVVRGEIRRLMVLMPPGSAKSTYTSDLLPPWFLGQRPQDNILACSHSAELAALFGRRARNRVIQHERTLEFSLRKDSQAADEWSTTKGGIFFCAGAGAGIAGRRADLGLIDDPYGKKEDAYSQTIRDKVWDWYVFDFRNRLKPNAAVILIMTPWHEDDLRGRLLATEGNEWEVIQLPYLAKEGDALGRAPGERLWPDWFNQFHENDAKKDPVAFSALFQLDPTPADGDYFKKEWFEKSAYNANELPDLKELVLYAASDHAVSEKESADLSCIFIVGVDAQGVIWVLPDLIWERMNSFDAVTAMTLKMKQYNLRAWLAEDEKITKAFGPFLRLRMRETGIFTYIEPMKPAKDKQTRAQSIRGRMQAGMVKFPRFAPWYQQVVRDYLKFPAGLHDDCIDPMAYVGLYLDMQLRGESAKPAVDETLHLKPTVITLDWVRKTTDRHNRMKELALLN